MNFKIDELTGEAYSGISLLRPFTSFLLLIAGFFSTGCSVLCSHQIGVGNKEEANEAFNLAAFLTLGCAVLIIVLGVLFPTGLMRICGVPLNKHPELHPHMYAYLKGYWLGIPAMMLLQIMGPILILDNGKKLFAFSTVVLCAVDIAGDLLNVFVFHGGVFGMGLATSLGYVVQFLVICHYLVRTESYFRLSLRAVKVRHLPEECRDGAPALVRKLSALLRDIVTNRFNVILALTSAAIAAKGIQGDLFQFLFCISTGLGRTLVGIAGIYYSAGDRNGLTRLYAYAIRVGVKISAVTGIASFICAPLVTRIYTTDPETVSLAVFSIRWMSAAFLFDPTLFYELNKADYPEEHLGIGIVMKKAKEVRYFSAFNSNNLIVMVPVTVTRTGTGRSGSG